MAISSLIFMAALTAQGAGGSGSTSSQTSAQPAAAESPAAPAKAAKPAKPEAPKKICVSEPQLGSHFKQRICATPDEWERRRVRDAEMMSNTGANTGPSSQETR